MSLSASPRPVGEIAGIRNGLSPPRLLPPRWGPQGSWSRGTPPARLPRDETRAPATLVDAVLYAPADVGSIPTVSTRRVCCAEGQKARIARQTRAQSHEAVRNKTADLRDLVAHPVAIGSQTSARPVPATTDALACRAPSAVRRTAEPPGRAGGALARPPGFGPARVRVLPARDDGRGRNSDE